MTDLEAGAGALAPDGHGEAAMVERSCIVTRAAGSPETMIRFVLSPDGEVVADLAGKLPGRGAWVTGTSALVAEAAKRGAFARAFKKPVKVAPDFAARIEALLRRRAMEALAIANKAGLVVLGFAKIEARLRDKPVAALVHALDAGADGRRKLDALLARQAGDGSRPALIGAVFSSAQLDLALGRTNVIHAALSRGGGAEMFIGRCRRVMTFCGGKPDAFDVLGGASDRSCLD